MVSANKKGVREKKKTNGEGKKKGATQNRVQVLNLPHPKHMKK